MAEGQTKRRTVLALAALGALLAGGTMLQRCSPAAALQREAQEHLLRLAAGIARCPRPELPRTTTLIPQQIAQVSGRSYLSEPDDWVEPAFVCAHFTLVHAQRLQYAWRQQSPLQGVATARGDSDGDGRPDVWFEVPVHCSAAGHCDDPGYVFEVQRDGWRIPPLLGRITGDAKRYRGAPPSAEAESPAPATTARTPPG